MLLGEIATRGCPCPAERSQHRASGGQDAGSRAAPGDPKPEPTPGRRRRRDSRMAVASVLRRAWAAPSLIHARASRVSRVLTNHSTSGQHRIRTCDLYGVKKPSDTHFRAVEMTVSVENTGTLVARQQKHHYPRFHSEKHAPLLKSGEAGAMPECSPQRWRGGAGVSDADGIRDYHPLNAQPPIPCLVHVFSATAIGRSRQGGRDSHVSTPRSRPPRFRECQRSGLTSAWANYQMTHGLLLPTSQSA